MRQLSTISASLGATILALAAAHTQAAEIDADRLFHQLDKNADGKIHRNEIGPEHRLLFSRLTRTGDADGDGWLTADEFAAGLEPVRAEKQPVEKLGSRLPGADAMVVILARMDANHDRRLDADEIPNEHEPLFERMLRPADANKDGSLDSREIARAAPRLSIMCQMEARRFGLDVDAELASLPPDQAAAMERMDAYGRPGQMLADPAQAEEAFARLDANGDKHLVLDEVPEPFAARFEQMLRRGDRDGDQRISHDEFSQVVRLLADFESTKPDPQAAKRIVRQMLRRLDADDDGHISAQEAPPRLAADFDRLDRDANGKLDREELAQVAEMMGRMQKLNDRGRRPPERPAAESSDTRRPKDDAPPSKAADKPRGKSLPK